MYKKCRYLGAIWETYERYTVANNSINLKSTTASPNQKQKEHKESRGNTMKKQIKKTLAIDCFASLWQITIFSTADNPLWSELELEFRSATWAVPKLSSKSFSQRRGKKRRNKSRTADNGDMSNDFFFFLICYVADCHNPPLRRVPTWPTVDESHMAVVYCRSSSGALSFKSRVSMATTTLDTWLGLSERAEIKRRNFESEEHGAPAERPRCRNTRNATNSSVLLRHSGCICTPLSPFNCPYKWDQAFQAFAQKNFSSSQITLESAQLAKYTVVHLVSFGLCYSSQPPSWSTADASTAEEFFHIKVFRS